MTSNSLTIVNGTAVLNATDILHRMCHKGLSQADVKAICKARGLPAAAASSPSVLESLFVTECGLETVFGSLEPPEIALLHRLKAVDKPVDVSFFSRLLPAGRHLNYYGTFTQRFQDVFKQVKERLVRQGVLLVAEAPHYGSNKTQMESWVFWLPLQFHAFLPPLIAAAKPLPGPGEWRHDVPRAKLGTAVGRALPERSTGKQAAEDQLQIADRELRWNGKPFRASELINWQKRGWQEDAAAKKKEQAGHQDAYALLPVDAAVQILGTLAADAWVDAASLATPLEVFCGSPIDSPSLCDSGYRWGCLARQQADGTSWYRLAPSLAHASLPPGQYLDTTADGTATVDLETVPLAALEQLVAISDQQPAPSGRPVLLLAPNPIKLGRMISELDALPPVGWLEQNSTPFREAIATCRQRSGKTILHENLAVARVSDLALKVAIEKALGARVVSLSDEYLAFPQDAFADVKRVVTKSGHVVKEVDSREA